jgi:hypothetical protein
MTNHVQVEGSLQESQARKVHASSPWLRWVSVRQPPKSPRVRVAVPARVKRCPHWHQRCDVDQSGGLVRERLGRALRAFRYQGAAEWNTTTPSAGTISANTASC